MRQIFSTLIVTILIVTFTTQVVQGQHFKKKSRYTSLGVSLNAMNYVGDLDPGQSFISPALRFTRMNLGAIISHRVGPRYTVRGAFSWGRIKGDDAISSGTEGDDVFRNIRNLSFRNDIYELKADFVVDLFQNRRGMERRANYTPYVFAGIAGFYHNPQTEYDNEWVDLQPLGTEGQYLDGVGQEEPYSRYQISLPFGVGFRYKIGMSLDLAFEIGWRPTFTDYLDDVGGHYVDKALFGSPGDPVYDLSDRSTERPLPDNAPSHIRVRQEGEHTYYNGYGDGTSNRGDVNGRNDWYIVTGFQLTYIFHPRVICPKFRG